MTVNGRPPDALDSPGLQCDLGQAALSESQVLLKDKRSYTQNEICNRKHIFGAEDVVPSLSVQNSMRFLEQCSCSSI
ncbi:hypothetical protein E5288_WYG008378 [Bos mutus]|uniref:Uncharacterized protein n=1 Tax=Bos mutus TaxID=72004 RepID=A0A6B0RLC0_9CETA|nr:hypothetical protein [Bos mutus]